MTLLEKSWSPWALLLVKKEKGSFCVDYCKLNAVTVRDSRPLPCVGDSLDALAGCIWFTTLLGYVLSADGLMPDLGNTNKLWSWPTPRTPSEVRSFMGLCSYYRRFIKNFSQHAMPLNRLSGENVPFEWTADCEVNFTCLNKAVTL